MALMPRLIDGVVDTFPRMGPALDAMRKAEGIVNKLPFRVQGNYVRCHEVARVVRLKLGAQSGWEVVDGHYGPYEHSWLASRSLRMILDVHSIRRLPLVQLVDPFALYGANYREGPERDDIRNVAIEEMLLQVQDRESCGT